MAKMGSSNNDECVIWDIPPHGLSLLLAGRVATLFLRE
ncbi:uncharacterized protein G2W53_009992 [Senna tora]|uniref:Uncharacterized protein n=1 Tax=Senna tora TaxID=362788 RepID=A0A834WZ49_9FABA|nr:uncharacterized protein G2W53_009992 [Senna tora]